MYVYRFRTHTRPSYCRSSRRSDRGQVPPVEASPSIPCALCFSTFRMTMSTHLRVSVKPLQMSLFPSLSPQHLFAERSDLFYVLTLYPVHPPQPISPRWCHLQLTSETSSIASPPTFQVNVRSQTPCFKTPCCVLTTVISQTSGMSSAHVCVLTG